MEAGALERPVIVTNIGAVGETVLAEPQVSAEQRTGWKIEPQRPDQLANAILEVLQLSQTERDAIGLRARQYVTGRFSLEAMCRSTISIYETLLTG